MPARRRRTPVAAALAAAALVCALPVTPALAGTPAATAGTGRTTAGTPVAPSIARTGSATARTGPASPEAPAEAAGGPLLGRRGTVVDRGAQVPALPGGIVAGSWLVADLDDGEVLAARNAHGRYAPASTLKILTALTLIPRLDPARTVRPSRADVDVIGSKVGLVTSLRYPVSTLFTALLVVSGNDAANTLASAAGGTAATLALMNAEAARLRAFDTRAGTPSGLDAPGQSSSAYDLALLLRAAMDLPDFRRYVATVRARVPAPGGRSFQIYTHNRLLTDYPGMLGGKNGYTIRSRASYAGVARRGGHTIVVTMMRARPDFWRQARALLDWGFAAAGRISPVGTLVEPAAPAAAAARLAAAPVPTAARPQPTASASGEDLRTPLGLLAANTVAVGYVLRARRRRRVRPRRGGR